MNTLYTYVQFGVDGNLYVEVTKPWCLTAKEKKIFYRHSHHAWCSWKISITFDLQGMKMMLSECEDCAVKALGGDNFQGGMKLSKMQPHIKMDNFLLEWRYGSKSVFL